MDPTLHEGSQMCPEVACAQEAHRVSLFTIVVLYKTTSRSDFMEVPPERKGIRVFKLSSSFYEVDRICFLLLQSVWPGDRRQGQSEVSYDVGEKLGVGLWRRRAPSPPRRAGKAVTMASGLPAPIVFQNGGHEFPKVEPHPSS